MATSGTETTESQTDSQPSEEVTGVQTKDGRSFTWIPEGLADVILMIEGKPLHANRALLAYFSTVFHRMFFSDFKEKLKKTVPLPDEKYEDMQRVLKLLSPRALQSEKLISDENLMQLLTFADKYDIEEVKVRCQIYIGSELARYYSNFYDYYTDTEWNGQRYVYLPISKDNLNGQKKSKPEMVNKLFLYVRACDRYDLPRHKETLQSMILELCEGLNDISGSEHYALLSPALRIELLESMCSRLDYQ